MARHNNQSGSCKRCMHSNYCSIIKVFTIIFISASFDVGTVCGLQSIVLADLKQVERAPARISNKVKRAQEVVMFGNQQNKLSEHNYVRADKRDIPNIPVPDVQNNLDKDDSDDSIPYEAIDRIPAYQQLPLRSNYYYERPEVYDMEMYEDRQKRNIHKRSPLKRSDRVFRSVSEDNGRIKRESQLDPEELLSLLAMWEAEQRRKHPSDSRPQVHYGQTEYEPYTNEGLNEIENDDVDSEGTWLDEPLFPHRYNLKPRFYPPYNNLIPSRPARRYR
ncbi:prohormone-2-like isoform X2 [Planococcus citri]|uniref:prohormone-2-like isoform X2 n=1 Tax=Planococcus citri TaxID=170843 RepID=UPI0031F9E440